MTAEQLSMIAGVVLSLAFSYIPGLKDWYASLEGTRKRLVMLGVLLISALAVFGLSCARLWIVVSCDQAGAIQLVTNFVAALISNQATFLISPQPAGSGRAAQQLGTDYEWRS
jgi:hypothetical protein